MEPRFTRGEYWLLDTVVEFRFPVRDLIADNLEEILNKKGHGLTRDTLIETLHRLISWELISAKNEVDAPISTPQQIGRALKEPSWRMSSSVDWKTYRKTVTRYGLTSEGGAQWEAFAAPDWQKYIYTSRHLPDDPDHSDQVIREAICADKARLERYFKSKCFYDARHVSLATVAWDYIAPWDVTYWKQLEGAHRVRFHSPDQTEVQNAKRYPLRKPEWHLNLWCAWR